MVYTVQIADSGFGYTLYLPVPELIRPAYERILREEPGSPFPFWAKVWPSSLALTTYLSQNTALIKGKNVLEIGAGIGIPSFTISPIAASVIISDHAAEAVELMNKNISHLGHKNVTARCVDWNEFPDEVTADLILLSDINYAPAQFDPLLKLIHRLILQGATIILATPQRIMAGPFVEALVQYQKEKTTIEVYTEEAVIPISIIKLQS